jgi:hypothetical protein
MNIECIWFFISNIIFKITLLMLIHMLPFIIFAYKLAAIFLKFNNKNTFKHIQRKGDLVLQNKHVGSWVIGILVWFKSLKC